MDAAPPFDAVSQDVAPGQDGGEAVDGAPPVRCDGVAFKCVPDVPPSWDGPFELAVATSSRALPTMCDAKFDAAQAVLGYEGLVAPPATCGCTCGPQKLTCDAIQVDFFAVPPTKCGRINANCYSAVLQPGGCNTLTASPGCSTVPGAPSATVAGVPSTISCPATPMTVTPALRWTTYAMGCHSAFVRAAADCPAGDICAPVPGGSFGSTLCIVQAGDVACPMTGYTSRSLYHGSASDGRGCSDCTCTPSGGSCDNPYLNVYSSTDGSCGGSPTSYLAPFTCDPVYADSDAKYTVTPTPGTCNPNSPIPTGSASAIDPFTVCCIP